jgi:hypothetical protein
MSAFILLIYVGLGWDPSVREDVLVRDNYVLPRYAPKSTAVCFNTLVSLLLLLSFFAYLSLGIHSPGSVAY